MANHPAWCMGFEFYLPIAMTAMLLAVPAVARLLVGFFAAMIWASVALGQGASVSAQSHGDVEHLVIDGASTDATLDEVQRRAHPAMRVISEPDKGIYDALSKGIALATGDVVGLMHSDDFFAFDDVLSDVARRFRDTGADAVYGDLDYVSADDPDNIVRSWKAGAYSRRKLALGWLPPHPTLYLRREVFERFGAYDIHANNSFPAEFIYENLMMEANVIRQAFAAGVRSLLFLGSSCIYPKLAPQPMREDALLTGTLGPTNEPYSIAKIAGIKLCESYNRQYGTDYRSVMPTNLYGPGDNFHPQNSHVLPALIRRFHEAARAGAPEVVVWGTGTPMREFLHVDDMAAASLFVLRLDKAAYDRETKPMLSHINVGAGTDVSIRELAETVARITGFAGRISFDATKPDGTPRKLMEVSRLDRMGWRATIGLEEGLRETYAWFLEQGLDGLRMG